MSGSAGGAQAAVPEADAVIEEQIATARSPFLDRVQEAYGEEAVQGLRSTFQKAYAARDKVAFNYFLGRREVPPPVDGAAQKATTEVPDVMDLVAKMLFYAPVEWFKVVTDGKDAQVALQNDFGHIGVAFDASSRLRRLGVEYYHQGLSTEWGDGLRTQREEHGGRPLTLYTWTERKKEEGEETNAEVRSYGAGGDLPEKRPGHVRVVCVSDTHLLHDRLKVLPPGDILVHAGDLCYEESRSLDRGNFEALWAHAQAAAASGEAAGAKFLEAFKGRRDFKLLSALEWLGSVPPVSGEFKARLLVGGNHDYILREIVRHMGVATAKELCTSFGKVQLLDQADPPAPVDVGPDARPVRVWGSPVSVVAGVADDRAVVSGNIAWMWDPKDEDEFHEEVLKNVETPGSIDIVVTHTPPKPGCLNGKEKRTFPAIYKFIETVQPSLYVCGHEHNDGDIFKGRIADGPDFVEGTVGVHASQVGTWNHAHGVPIVVDVKLRD